ncbi:MAG: dTDP-4-amino-4,6-dideoxygalactose transaminase [Candidatus Methylacidiphilales bacterium]
MNSERPSIPFNAPTIVSRELHYISQAILWGHSAGDGEFSRRCHDLLGELTQTQKVLLTPSCTAALEMCALLLEIAPGDEVILPSYTFVSTANAFVLRGATPRFVDIRTDTFNLDEQQVEAQIGPRTRAIVVVHYAGVACEMDVFTRLAEKYRLVLIEDNAHGILGKYRGRPLGSFGQLATLSFHETKNFTCGEGGALLVNDPQWMEKAEILRDKGTNRKKFFRGEVDKYSWVSLGSSYVLSDLLAAFLLAQLESRDYVVGQRKRLWHGYYNGLRDWAESNGVQLPYVPPYCEQSYHMFYLLMPSLEERSRLIAHLKQQGILAVFHYQPLHLSEMGHRMGCANQRLPNTERAADCLVRLPFFTSMTDDQRERVIACVREFKTQVGS